MDYLFNRMREIKLAALGAAFFLFLLLFIWKNISSSASLPEQNRSMVVTAYCGCADCCSWERGSWMCLKLDFWNRYVASGPRKGRPYDGKTADCSVPREPRAGLFSTETIQKPWKIPLQVVIPPLAFPREGTIAADTEYYPFGTRMYVPEYGWGVVSDRGGAIKGPDRIDLYMNSHDKAKKWGHQTLEVQILPPAPEE
jgi:hypothetical protein